METILLQKTLDGMLSCEVGITTDEWTELLTDESVTTRNYKEALMAFYNAPEHKSTCKNLDNPERYNTLITQFGKAVTKKLDRFKIIGDDNKKRYWPVAMGSGKDIDGLFEWTMRSELVEAIENIGWNKKFTWIPFYSEMADKLLQFRNNRKPLVDIMYGLGEEATGYITAVGGGKVEDIDPFTVMGIFNRSMTDGNRIQRIKYFKDALIIEADIPSDFFGIPVMNNMMSTFYWREHIERDVPEMWDLFEAVISNDKEGFKEHFDKVCQHDGIKWNITFALFWIRPNDFISLDANNRNYLPSLGIEMFNESEICSEKYLGLLDNLKSKIQNKEVAASSIPEISYLAWESSNNSSESRNYWLVGYSFGSTNSQLDRFIQDGIWEGGFDEDKKIDSKQLALVDSFKPGDVLILKSSSVKDPRTNPIPFLRVCAIGVIESDITKYQSEDGFTRCKFDVKYYSIEKKDFLGNKFGAYRKTVQKAEPKIQEIIDYANNAIDPNSNMKPNYQQYIDLLKENYNLVLTGAPGTGKTYMAKEIAKAMGAEMAFVQFHPSYDYSDFVEGLRPVVKGDGQMGFVRCDGVFKEFCKKAIKNIEDSNKTTEEIVQEMSLEDCYNKVIDKIENGEISDFMLKTGSKGMIVDKISENNNIILKTPNSNSDRTYTVSFDRISKLAKVFTDIKSLDEISNINDAIRGAIGGCNASSYWAVLRAVYEQTKDVTIANQSTIEKKPYVFIIDEINRGEASKIFGELFYAIDPGYRGNNDVPLKTQYQNMIPDTDAFCNGFYVPENVYILATMNDIDRSVESMDFAMRRRFTWIEVTPEDTQDMLNSLGEPLASKAKETMSRLNAAIAKTDGLGTAYMIGGSYFKRLEKNGGDFEKLWTMNLEPLLKEYLRGFRKADDIMLKFKQAYTNVEATEDSELTDVEDDED